MQNEFKLHSLLLAVVLFGMTCNSQKEQSIIAIIDKAQIKKDIQAKEVEFATIYNSKQLIKIRYYADATIFYSQNSRPIIGKMAIVKFLEKGINFSQLGSKISFVTNEVFPSNDRNKVVEIGYYKSVNANDSILNSRNYMVLFEKRNGRYISLREMSISDISFQ